MNGQELLGKYAQGIRDFTGANLNECSLIGANLSEIILQDASLNVANLSSANLNHSDFKGAQLNVTRLSGANLSHADLSGSKLNVANLIRVILTSANLTGASLIRAEMVRATLSQGRLVSANCSEADLREAHLDRADLHYANLTRADLRGSVLAGANLTQAILNGVDASRANFNGAVLKDVELRQGNLSQADLRGANLKGANLRWADLSGANLRDADLTDAKLSGANLTGASLEGANLVNTVLVHADLTHANLMQATWVGSDLSGATLTGAKLFGTVRYSLTFSNETICEWIDLSPNGDQSRTIQFGALEKLDRFFNRSPAQVRITIDSPLSTAAHQTLAAVGYQLSTLSPLFESPPSLEVTSRKTVQTYTSAHDMLLPALAYGAAFPFQDRETAQHSILDVLKQLQQYLADHPEDSLSRPMLSPISGALTITAQRLGAIAAAQPAAGEGDPFFQAPIQIELINSSNQRLDIYQNPRFGLRPSLSQEEPLLAAPELSIQLPLLSDVLTFFKGCRPPETVTSQAIQ
ncbi:pentapeptide repeat-containing protein [Pseudanabaena sp. FACHB-2040]|uniref:pentapeptide repeat-containing protein n=1 Tax=Pseudanabaena sp. FACHB-2040 TaxID=2692859 RepID=UPI00168829B7|nr:pentapeptide repeat-containing protein [Pseudanabaena sp. FACHB-2040]MBD2257899.1 pentapeptide repeat-containing protein [Pseudanabaena sp. FACHB-2040]